MDNEAYELSDVPSRQFHDERNYSNRPYGPSIGARDIKGKGRADYSLLWDEAARGISDEQADRTSKGKARAEPQTMQRGADPGIGVPTYRHLGPTAAISESRSGPERGASSSQQASSAGPALKSRSPIHLQSSYSSGESSHSGHKETYPAEQQQLDDHDEELMPALERFPTSYNRLQRGEPQPYQEQALASSNHSRSTEGLADSVEMDNDLHFSVGQGTSDNRTRTRSTVRNVALSSEDLEDRGMHCIEEVGTESSTVSTDLHSIEAEEKTGNQPETASMVPEAA